MPPWVEYRKGELRSVQVPFDKYFRVHTLAAFHRVITMAEFMLELAPRIWPPSARTAFCYMERQSLDTTNTDRSCNAKEGNPFGPFWDEFQIDFVASEYYGPLNYDVYRNDMVDKWHQQYPASDWPVLAFTGAPATFPVQFENRHLHRHLQWSDEIRNRALAYRRDRLPKGAFIGVHLRNGMDWIRACEHIRTSPNLFAAAQCLGYRNERGNATMDMCMPGRDLIVRQLKRVIKKAKEIGPSNEIRAIFVASDSNHMIDELNEALQRMKVKAYRFSDGDADATSPHVDLAILAMSNHFIGNCVSSYSAFAKRERDARGFPSSFWGFPTEKSAGRASGRHEEL